MRVRRALVSLLVTSEAPQSQPGAGTVPETAPISSTIPVQQQLADALADIDPEVLRLFLLNRKISDGTLGNVPDDYATKVLSHLPMFKAILEKFAKEPF
jgi:hypothetical protein